MAVRLQFTSIQLMFLLLCSALLATTLQGVQGEVDVEGPSESECRPYIEKALKKLETGDAQSAEVQDDIAHIVTTDDSEIQGDSLEITDAETSKSAEEETQDDDAKSVEEEIGQSKEQDASAETGDTQEVSAEEKDVTGATEEVADESAEKVQGEASAEKDTQETQSEEKQDDTAEQSSVEEATVEQASVEDTTAEPASKEEVDEGSVEQEGNVEQDGSVEKEASVEEGTEQVQSAEEEGSVEQEGSQEQADEPKGEESAEQTAEESAEQTAEESAEQTAESAEQTAESAEQAEGSVEQKEESGEQREESVEQENESAEQKEESVEQTAESAEQAVESAEQATESAQQSAESVEQTAESIEQAAESAEQAEGSVEQKEESTEQKEESGEQKEESAEQKEESGEQKDESAEKVEAEASQEHDASAEKQESVEQEAASVEKEVSAEVTEEKESGEQTAEVESAEKAESAEKTESAEKAESGEEKVTDEASTEAEAEKESAEQEQADEAASTEQATESEPTPEEDLTWEIEIPTDLRPRDHVNEILHLNDETSETDSLLLKAADSTLKELKRIYENAIQPLETLYKYRDLSNRHFGDPEIFSKPLVLFMGPWSGGKSSIINYLLDNEYTQNSLRTGAEPSPAYFNLLMWGEEPAVLDGTQLAADWTFSGLQKFGQGLEERLRGLKLPNKLLEKINIAEIPGILEVRKQVSRVFPFNDACQWFIDRADIIFLVYDPSKLDVGPETEAILDQLKGREYQTRIILNKADQVHPEELMRVQGALIWNISPLMSSAQPPVMYSTSLWSKPYEIGAPIRLLHAQERAFLRDLKSAIDKRIDNKIASARRFAVRVRNHAKMVDCYLTTYYNHKSVFGNKKLVADQIIEHPQDYHIYEGLSTLTNISRYDLPDPDVYRDFFRLNPLYDFQQLSATCTYFRGCPINRLDIAIAYDLPELVGKHKKNVETIQAGSNTDSSTKS